MKQQMNALDPFRKRESEIRAWLTENHPETFSEQRHIAQGTAERAYWHHGYLMAVRDMLKALGDGQPKQ